MSPATIILVAVCVTALNLTVMAALKFCCRGHGEER